MSNLPFTLPTCDQPATTRVEVYSPANGVAFGSLDGSIYTCDEHDADAVTATWAANLTPFRVILSPDVDRRCGEGYVYPTGALGGQR